jgi:uncharacterized protein YcaQ
VDALIDVLVGKYAPLPGRTLSELVWRLRYAAPHLRPLLRPGLERARRRLRTARLGGVDWYWPVAERPGRQEAPEIVRLLAPFDPVVWDRRRFELFWDWPYRFEAYTPAAKRKLGYYALPLLWRDRVAGWANVTGAGPTVAVEVGYQSGRPPAGAAFRRELEAEIERLRRFLG